MESKIISVEKNREFQLLFKKGYSYVTYGFVCYYLTNKRQNNRLGVVASKKVGNAVKRNRAKRVIREAFRLAQPKLRDLPVKYDFVFVARGKTPYIKSTQIYELITNGLFKKIL
jgi:ribonuclease P protein component